MRSPSSTSSKGASALEFALVLPLLVLLLMGILDWGYYFYAEQVVTNAAREGARAGSLQATEPALAQSEALAAVRAHLTGGGLEAARATVAADLGADSVRVVVDYPTGSLTGLTGLVVPAGAHAAAEMRR